jgi:hypothetical protein
VLAIGILCVGGIEVVGQMVHLNQNLWLSVLLILLVLRMRKGVDICTTKESVTRSLIVASYREFK